MMCSNFARSDCIWKKSQIRIISFFDMQVGQKTYSTAGADAHDYMFPAGWLHSNIRNIAGIFAHFIAQWCDADIVYHNEITGAKDGKINGRIRILLAVGILLTNGMVYRQSKQNFLGEKWLEFQRSMVQRGPGEAKVQLAFVSHALYVSGRILDDGIAKIRLFSTEDQFCLVREKTKEERSCTNA